MGRPTLLRVGLVHYETLHQKDALVSTFFCLFLSLKIVTMFRNFVLLNVCKYFSLLMLLYSLQVSAVLDHFGYLAPHLDQWQQRVWYDLGATQEVLHQMRIRLSRGLPAIASPPRAESPPPSRRPAAAPIRPNHGGKSVKASKGESSAPGTASTGPSSPIATTSPKTEIKKKRKRKPSKCTVTSETVSPPEKKKKKVISESPDSQAEGPFYDTDTASAPGDSPHAI